MRPIDEPTERTYSRIWLMSPAAVGLLLILFNLIWASRQGVDSHNALPGVLSDVGVALLLFSVLFVVERRIERRILKSIRLLTKSEAEVYSEGASDPLVFGDFDADSGPMATALVLLEAIMEGNFNKVWTLSDPNLRECRAQAWIFNNTETLNITSTDFRDSLAYHLVTGPHPGESLWESFAEMEIAQLKDVFDGYSEGRWGWSRRRRIIGPRHEALLLTPLPREAPFGFIAEGPTLLDGTHRLIFRCISTDEGAKKRFYLFAGYGSAPPLPGWPPAFWLEGDPVALENHPGVYG